jgi:hypothetical protein
MECSSNLGTRMLTLHTNSDLTGFGIILWCGLSTVVHSTWPDIGHPFGVKDSLCLPDLRFKIDTQSGSGSWYTFVFVAAA